MSLFFDLDTCDNFEQVYDYFRSNQLFDTYGLTKLKNLFNETHAVNILINKNKHIRFTELMREEDINFWVQTGWTVYTFTE